MNRPRLAWLGLAAVVGLSVLGYVAIRHPSPVVASLVFTVALTMLLASILAACLGRYRTFWLGFVVFGWGYALLAFAPGAWSEVRPFLATSRLLDALHGPLGLPAWPYSPGFGDREAIPTPASLARWDLTDAGDRYQRIGHSFAAVFHGAGGGVLALVLASRKRPGDVRDGRP